MARRRTCSLFLSLLALFLLGTVVVLSTVSFYLSIDPKAYITEAEVQATAQQSNASDRTTERIPRILHQTWLDENLPERWVPVSQACRDLMPDYEYMLWTDEKSRDLIATDFPWFLSTFDGYRWPIQRADAIRYFILLKYGGIYLDLDIGCLKRLDPLLVHPVILPRTIPVGVSNDLMFSEQGHPFMEQTVQNLINFDHSYVLNYPTVMFSTGPMFLSAQYGLYTSAHPGTPGTAGEVRILPKSLYGKNAAPGEAPNSFFEHYYGSSWHSDDAWFITFLGKYGRNLMWIGAVIVILGFVRAYFLRRNPHNHWRRQLALVVPYPVFTPRPGQPPRTASIHLDLSNFPVSEATSEDSSPSSSEPSTPSAEARIPLLPVFEMRSPSPSASTTSLVNIPASAPRTTGTMLRNAGRWAWEFMGGENYIRHSRGRSRSRRRGVTFYLPALFDQGSDPEASSADLTPRQPAESDKKTGTSTAVPHTIAPPPYAPPQGEWNPFLVPSTSSSTPASPVRPR